MICCVYIITPLLSLTICYKQFLLSFAPLSALCIFFKLWAEVESQSTISVEAFRQALTEVLEEEGYARDPALSLEDPVTVQNWSYA
jgi:hypothetical protein